MIDEWDLYGQHFDMTNPEHSKLTKEYQKFRENNSNLYK